MARPETFPDEETVSFSVTMPATVKARMELEARKEHRTLSGQITDVLKTWIESREPAAV